MIASKARVQSLYIPLNEIEMAQNNSVFAGKTSTTAMEKWHEPSNKSEITMFYTEKNSKFTGSFS